MTREQKQLLALGLAVAGGLALSAALRRWGPSGGLAEVDGRYQAVTAPGGRYLRCEEYKVIGDRHITVGVVADSKCRGCGGFEVPGCPK